MQGDYYFDSADWLTAFDRPALRAHSRYLTIHRMHSTTHVGFTHRTLECDGARRQWTSADTELRRDWKEYKHSGLRVIGRREPVPVTIIFEPWRQILPYAFLPGEGYPAVYAGDMPESPHRYSDGSLCLYYPGDPPRRQWTSKLGLSSLLSLVADHLFFEDVFRDKGKWIAPEAPHGIPNRRRA